MIVSSHIRNPKGHTIRLRTLTTRSQWASVAGRARSRLKIGTIGRRQVDYPISNPMLRRMASRTAPHLLRSEGGPTMC